MTEATDINTKLNREKAKARAACWRVFNGDVMTHNRLQMKNGARRSATERFNVSQFTLYRTKSENKSHLVPKGRPRDRCAVPSRRLSLPCLVSVLPPAPQQPQSVLASTVGPQTHLFAPVSGRGWEGTPPLRGSVAPELGRAAACVFHARACIP